MKVRWRKSARSGGVSDEHCVELGRLGSGVGVRDSKDPDGTYLVLGTGEFAAFLDAVKAGRRGGAGV
ncbi:DUF397 domain-containing protein [Actinomadura roseirufa]|uniref:DUF397 domain-containing protein n=1 Tax=Actinomadura roseirufa TaxID=2094049 RepID=UPI001041226D|nr:DUF397 domain-containing protein [Actinomadura roseirufa]